MLRVQLYRSILNWIKITWHISNWVVLWYLYTVLYLGEWIVWWLTLITTCLLNINGYNLRCSKTILNKRHIRQSCFNFVIHFLSLVGIFTYVHFEKYIDKHSHIIRSLKKTSHIAVTFNYRESMVLIIITQDRLDIRFSPHVFLVTWCYLWQNVAILRQSIWIRVWLYVIQSEIL